MKRAIIFAGIGAISTAGVIGAVTAAGVYIYKTLSDKGPGDAAEEIVRMKKI